MTEAYTRSISLPNTTPTQLDVNPRDLRLYHAWGDSDNITAATCASGQLVLPANCRLVMLRGTNFNSEVTSDHPERSVRALNWVHQRSSQSRLAHISSCFWLPSAKFF